MCANKKYGNRLVWSCIASLWPYMVFNGKISSFLAVIDQNSFGLVPLRRSLKFLVSYVLGFPFNKGQSLTLSRQMPEWLLHIYHMNGHACILLIKFDVSWQTRQ